MEHIYFKWVRKKKRIEENLAPVKRAIMRWKERRGYDPVARMNYEVAVKNYRQLVKEWRTISRRLEILERYGKIPDVVREVRAYADAVGVKNAELHALGILSEIEKGKYPLRGYEEMGKVLALEKAAEFGWVKKEERGKLVLTERGRKVLEALRKMHGFETA